MKNNISRFVYSDIQIYKKRNRHNEQTDVYKTATNDIIVAPVSSQEQLATIQCQLYIVLFLFTGKFQLCCITLENAKKKYFPWRHSASKNCYNILQS